MVRNQNTGCKVSAMPWRLNKTRMCSYIGGHANNTALYWPLPKEAILEMTFVTFRVQFN